MSDDEKDYLEMNEEVKNPKEPKVGISIVKKYEDLFKGANRKTINIMVKQGELLKRFEDSDEFFYRVGLSRSSIYFKIRLYNFSCKFPILIRSTLTSSYFKSSLKLIKKVSQANANIFGEKKSKYLFHYFLSLFG